MNHSVDATLHALAHPHRRQVVDSLSTGARSSSQLAEITGLRLNALARHLDALAGAGLIRSVKSGRVMTHHLSAQPLEELSGWLGSRAAFWRSQLDHLATSLED